MAKARILISQGALAGTRVDLRDEPVLVGRAASAGLRLDPHRDRAVSSRHALLLPSAEGWVIRDLGSRNGTFVNGERVQDEVGLRDGDTVQLGVDGPLLVFNPAADESSAVTTAFQAPSSGRPGRAAGRKGRRRSWITVSAVGLAAVGAWLLLRSPGGVGPEPRPVTSGLPVEAPSTTAPPMPDQVAALEEELAEARREADSLRRDLERATEEGRPSEDVDVLEQRLQDLTAALRRQQMATSLDFARLERVAGGAVAQVFADFDGRVLAATGFAVTPDGHFLTSRHVVRGPDGERPNRIAVQPAGSPDAFPASVVGVAATSDLALLAAEGAPSNLPHLGVFNEAVDTLQGGTPLAAFGYPLGGATGVPEGGSGVRPLVTAGIFLGRSANLLQIEGYGAEGSSGSPLLDGQGRVVGVLRGGRGAGSDRVLFAVPADVVLAFLARWLDG